ncbi:MAG: hypothetical protein JW850_14425 [Thermoflexales bacterium]|nr:hypothetical protein [Thermoflexales bacterium]
MTRYAPGIARRAKRIWQIRSIVQPWRPGCALRDTFSSEFYERTRASWRRWRWHWQQRAVGGGGATSAGANGYTLGGTVGQPDAAVWSGGGYTLAGGFWGGVAGGYRIYLPVVVREYRP